MRVSAGFPGTLRTTSIASDDSPPEPNSRGARRPTRVDDRRLNAMLMDRGDRRLLRDVARDAVPPLRIAGSMIAQASLPRTPRRVPFVQRFGEHPTMETSRFPLHARYAVPRPVTLRLADDLRTPVVVTWSGLQDLRTDPGHRTSSA